MIAVVLVIGSIVLIGLHLFRSVRPEQEWVVDLPIHYLPQFLCSSNLVWCNHDKDEPKHTFRTIYYESEIGSELAEEIKKFNPVRLEETRREDSGDYRPIHVIVGERRHASYKEGQKANQHV